MKILKNIVIALHKYLGTLMSGLFLMWCLTGFVLLFVGFPHASRQERYIHLESLSESSLHHVKPVADTYPKGVSLEMCNGRPVYRIKKGKKRQSVVDAQTLLPIDSFSLAECRALSLRFHEGDIQKIERITELDSWIPWSYYKPLLPFYKFYYNDDAHSAIYVSSVIGTVVQETTRHTRWMARVGAIPHWVYFKQIKPHVELRKKLIIVLALLGFFASLSGLILGFIRLKRNKRGKVCGLSVFRKRTYRCHHILGLFVGLFLCTYMLSGMFYVTGVSSWISPKKSGKSAYSQWNKEASVASVLASDVYDQLPKSGDVRQISWGESMGQPFVQVYHDNYKIATTYIVDSALQLRPFYCDSKDVLLYAQGLFPETKMQVGIQDAYDYFYEENGMYYRPIPAIKLTLNTSFKDVLYIDPSTGKAVAHFDNNKRIKRVLSKTLHKLDFPFVHKYDKARLALNLLILSLCTVVCFTAVVLGVRYLKRT